ncbi:MAG: hypothetical protein JSV46_07715 [Candidatus Aminicenantes bacterium]|nr:MAG: hypothetical protein JSV46_07715 [Candidatus Aminicenantes bacterium]
MNPVGKKFISLFLVLSLTVLPTSLYARKRGAVLIITKIDGQKMRGELIAVKKNALLLLDSKTKIDLSINVREIKFIKVGKKSKVIQGMGVGAVVGSLIGMIVGATKKIEEDGGETPVVLYILLPLLLMVPSGEKTENMVNGLLIGAGVGLLAGTFFGVLAEKNRHRQIEGMIDLEIQKALDKLRKKARVPNYK